MRYIKLATLSFLCVLSACVYEPEQFVASDKGSAVESTEIGKIFPVDTNQQTCNASVSQDTVNFPASMLWLNFGGTLRVGSPDTNVYDIRKAIQHDRLSVVDTSGRVLWFVKADFDAGDCQFQDPEWSTHPNYIVALRAFDINGKKGCVNLDFGLFAMRMSDKKKFFFYDKDVSELATPHLWVDPSAVRDTAVADSTVEGFFGTNQVRLVYVNKENQIVFVDFANGGLKNSKKLVKPSDIEEGWMMDSPLISPDGHFVVYNLFSESMTEWRSFVQILSDKSKPIEIERLSGMISNPVQPHWFKYGSRLFVEWAEFPQGEPFVNTKILTDASAQDGSAGRTAMREVSVAPGAPLDLAFAWVGDVIEVAPVPMIGGRSPDGRYLATGTNKAYLLELP